MTFDELQLCIAIENAGRGKDTPRTNQQRIDLAKRVFPEWLRIVNDSLFPFSIDDIVRWGTALRKSKEMQVKVKVAELHGTRCFWANRDKGPCCETAECGHLWQNSKGGPLSIANCVIECRSHNNQRRELGIEEYIKSNRCTPEATQ
jgi:hypothetical protein